MDIQYPVAYARPYEAVHIKDARRERSHFCFGCDNERVIECGTGFDANPFLYPCQGRRSKNALAETEPGIGPPLSSVTVICLAWPQCSFLSVRCAGRAEDSSADRPVFLKSFSRAWPALSCKFLIFLHCVSAVPVAVSDNAQSVKLCAALQHNQGLYCAGLGSHSTLPLLPKADPLLSSMCRLSSANTNDVRLSSSSDSIVGVAHTTNPATSGS